MQGADFSPVPVDPGHWRGVVDGVAACEGAIICLAGAVSNCALCNGRLPAEELGFHDCVVGVVHVQQ